MISQKFHNHSVIIHLGRLLRCINVKIWKMPWKLRFSESQYCFANISATETQIFMKFYVVFKYYLVSLSFKFHGDLCTYVRARVINAHTCDETCALLTFHITFFWQLLVNVILMRKKGYINIFMLGWAIATFSL